MQDNFEQAFQWLLDGEGGYVDNPADPGGMTNLGVTKRTWESYVGHDVTENEMRALTPDKVRPLYKARYWDLVSGDKLPAGVDYCVFDTCVNSGPGRAAGILQDVLGVTQDNRIGPQTLSAASKQDAGTIIINYTTTRLMYLKGLRTWETFGGGWEKRVLEVEDQALGMSSAGGAAVS